MTERPYMPIDLAMRNDTKVGALEEENPALVTLWIYLLSMMYEEKGPLERNYRRLAYLLRFPTEEDVRHVVEDSGLFVWDDTHFWNESALERIDRKDAYVEQQREAGRRGGRPRKSTPESDPFENQKGLEKGSLFEKESDPFENQKANKSNKLNKSNEINQSAGAGAPTREEDDFLIYEFFFRNFRRPGQEVARCLENYKGQEVKNWGKVAAAWQPADTAPRFDDPRALQWARELFGIILQGNDRQTACECLRHIDDIAIDKNRNELKVRMRGDAWLKAVKGLLTAHPELLEGYEAVNTCKCVGS